MGGGVLGGGEVGIRRVERIVIGLIGCILDARKDDSILRDVNALARVLQEPALPCLPRPAPEHQIDPLLINRQQFTTHVPLQAYETVTNGS